MINICNLVSCGTETCPFEDECDLNFKNFRPKEEWIDVLEEKIENLQKILDKLNKM